MEVAPNPECNGSVIFCDDVRAELGGKVSFMGVYDGRMFLHGALPFVLAKFCIVIRFAQRRATFVPNVALRIYLPGDADDRPSFEVEVPAEEGAKGAQAAFEAANSLPAADTEYIAMLATVPFSPMTLERTGEIRVQIIRDNVIHRIGKLEVHLAPNQPTA